MPRILVADDNTNIQKMVALAFQERGIDVTSVGNGEAAVRRLSDISPDVILADIFMPVRNGYELCEWVKKDAKFAHIPVILLVGAFDPLDEKEARRVGADGVLKKPFIPPDPLIAMVTAVLEKNPKLTADAAKPKESAPQAAVPAIAAIEVPAKITPKAVPEFPEPSPEEASLIYGFGKGTRGLDDGAVVAEAVPPKAEKEADEEFDGASTTSDWRRSAMDFEIPEETARKPAFSSDEDLEPTPGAHQSVPPPDFPIPDARQEIEPAPLPSPEAEPAAFVPVMAQAAEISEPVITKEEDSEKIEFEPVAPIVAEMPLAPTRPPDLSLAAAQPPEQHEAPAMEIQGHSEPGVPPTATHWMDLMASPAEAPKSDWFESTFGAFKTAQHEVPGELKAAGSEVVELPNLEEDSFFADEPESAEALTPAPANREPAIPQETPTPVAPQLEAEPVSQADVEEQRLGGAPPFPELVQEESIVPSLAKDPELVEPPAVHVTPEPLLAAEEEAPGPSLSYGAHEQDIAPLHFFLAPASQQPAQSGAVEEPAAPEPPVEQAASEETSVRHEDPAPPSEFSVAEFERELVAATALPPSGEGLESIPFLNPPPAFRDSRFGSDTEAAKAADTLDPSTVNAIVEKVLERIEPQLRELLSQNVLKPLVESLLHADLEKKSH